MNEIKIYHFDKDTFNEHIRKAKKSGKIVTAGFDKEMKVWWHKEFTLKG